MFWADKILEAVETKYKDKIAKGEPLVIRDEKTASGRVHVGSMRGVAIHAMIDEVCTEKNIKHTFLYEINDYDPMDGLPIYLDREVFLPHMGKLLCNVPSPDGKAKNYAEYFADEFKEVILKAGFNPKFYRSSELYLSGQFNEAIRLALENADLIRAINKEISGSERVADALPLSVICEKCGKVGTTKARDFDGETVEYTCGKFVEWADGCGHNGRISPFDGRAKLPWKVEWAAKFMILKVDIEGGGKDHSTKGGARDVAEAIARRVFKVEPPMNIPYEFFQIGGKKMSSSKGAGSSSKEISDLLPTDIFRFLLIYKEPNKVLEFDPQGDTVPVLFDTFDTFATNYFKNIGDDFARCFFLAHPPTQRKNITPRHLPRFSTVVFISQMPHVDAISEIEKLQEITLTDDDKIELARRIEYAEKWVKTYAPDEYKFEIQKNVPPVALNFNDIQKQALSKLLDYLGSVNTLDGQALHSKLHDIKAETGIEPKDFFSALYLAVLGKKSGPKAGWFLSVIDKDFLVKRLKEVI